MSEHVKPTGINLSNKTYDMLRRFVEYILPGASVLYLTLSELWHLPNAMQVAGTLAAIAVFGGVMLKASRRTYAPDEEYDGEIVPDLDDPENPKYRFLLNTDDAEAILNKDKIVFKGMDTST